MPACEQAAPSPTTVQTPLAASEAPPTPPGDPFSNASLSGKYVFHYSGTAGDHVDIRIPLDNDGNQPPVIFSFMTVPVLTPTHGIGTFVADGGGNITSGAGFNFAERLNETNENDPSVPPSVAVVSRSCNVSSITGTYSINSDGTGTMTLSPVGPSCPGETVTLNLILGRRGGAGVFYTTPAADPGTFSGIVSGGFTKQ